uniref:Uncharacterized protein n=2 Tax=Timema TaxID=61471 RepID=A0A7R8VRN1_TIMDO|nr:unnamed protein product [Timema douglasi]
MRATAKTPEYSTGAAPRSRWRLNAIDWWGRHCVPWKGVVETPVSGKGASRPTRPICAAIMLINLVKDSVLQCFCHTCRAPLPPSVYRRSAPTKKTKTKPRSKQPKKVKFIRFKMKSKQFVSFVRVATEIRCQEKSKGGLAYEVILADPVTVTPPKRPSSPSNKNVSVENIEEKLKAAEERRLNLEANRMAHLAVKMSKIEEASKKKDDQAHQFISQTREALEQKMETHEEKREAYISDLKAKLKDHLETVEKTRQSLEAQTEEVRTAVEEKLKTAAAQRDENIKKMLDRLKEHWDAARQANSKRREAIEEMKKENEEANRSKTPLETVNKLETKKRKLLQQAEEVSALQTEIDLEKKRLRQIDFSFWELQTSLITSPMYNIMFDSLPKEFCLHRTASYCPFGLYAPGVCSVMRTQEDNVKRVRSTMQEKVTQLESQIQNKLTLAQTRRKNLEQEQLEKLREHNVVKLAEVRHIIEGMDSFKTEKTTKELQERLEIAELNREKELQKKLEKIQEKERRAEMVRQNKERLASQNEEQQTASSG